MQAELPFAPPLAGGPEEPSDLEAPRLTAQQRRAVALREGNLLLDASAGSGKTSVLVERFARAVVQDGVDVQAILAITFTEKAAAELRDRIRTKLRSLGAGDQARASDGAFISTIHGFCARILRSQALTAGIDPEFVVLDEPDARGLALAAFEDALAELAAASPDATDLIASYRPDQLRGAILGTYAELRSRGEREPGLPQFPAACEDDQARRFYGMLDRLLRLFSALYEERKRDRSGLDFADLELIVRDLFTSRTELRERFARRFERVMVDELQDVNAVQLELIEAIARNNLFAVGDAQQSIYGFRHADVELFERLGERLAQVDRRMTLDTNFRSRPEILEVINGAFTAELRERFRALRAGLPSVPSGHGEGPLVELMIVEKCAGWPAAEILYPPWRVAEARALARRIERLLASGAKPRDVVVLMRATPDMRCYERALEARGIPTYVIGGRGYWAHPQVIDLMAYLRALANPQDEEALYTVLASPLVGTSLDALVLVAAAAREAAANSWWMMTRRLEEVDELASPDRRLIEEFVAWLSHERDLAARVSVEELIERALERTGYDLYMLSLVGGERRLANVRKLMRLGREYAVAHGCDLRGFLEFAGERRIFSAGPEDSEAPVEGEALDAVRLMTIHRAKGLEFEIVCIADLGRETPRGHSGDILRVGADGRVGLRLASPGTGKSVPILDHAELCDEVLAAEAAEERRLFYVAMTRARERLILSGAAKLEPDGQLTPNGRGAPIGWVAPALQQAGVAPLLIRPADEESGEHTQAAPPAPATEPGEAPAQQAQPEAQPAEPEAQPAEPEASVPSPAAPSPLREDRPLPALSYSSLTEYQRCGYRFYLQRILGIPDQPSGITDRSEQSEPSSSAAAVERGILAHELLAGLDFKRPVKPTAQAIDAAALRAGVAPRSDEALADAIYEFTRSSLARRLAAAAWARPEERFSFLLEEGPLITGVFDVIAGEAGDRVLVVDYKTDRLEGRHPDQVVASGYASQRLIYGLAALRAGALEVEVAHVFLERPERPATVTFTHADAGRLERELEELASGVGRGEFAVADEPKRTICVGCPAEGGLCPWPLDMTRR
ncbi:MAG TPA: UvrD-helicase domain-containing protein [Solirubrobacteraceae bacterium]|nr:UvrD-helicase domain-containing protein [Solirubrobacteraceae bacterium]